MKHYKNHITRQCRALYSKIMGLSITRQCRALYSKIMGLSITRQCRALYSKIMGYPTQLLTAQKLANCPTLTTDEKDFWQRYVNLLQTSEIIRPAKPPLRVAIHAHHLHHRVLRIAQMLHNYGVSVLFIFENNQYNVNLLNNSAIKYTFSNVYTYRFLVNEMPLILKAINNFGADIIHSDTTCHKSNGTAIWLLSSNLPIVADCYDWHNAQYDYEKSSDDTKRHADFEALWLKHVDGLCLRQKYLDILDKKGLYKRGTPVVLIPDVMLQENIDKYRTNLVKKLSADDGKLHILFAGHFSTLNGPIDGVDEVLPYLVGTNIILHILSTHELALTIPIIEENYSRFRKYDFVKTYREMDNTEYMKFMASMDILTCEWGVTESRVVDTGILFGGGLRQIVTTMRMMETIEADIIFIMPSVYKNISNYNLPTNRFIAASESDINSPQFWKSLKARVDALYKLPANTDKMTDVYYAPRLVKFYERVIKNYKR